MCFSIFLSPSVCWSWEDFWRALLALTITEESLSAGQFRSKIICSHPFRVFYLSASPQAVFLSGLAWPYLISECVMGIWIPVMVHGGLAHTGSGAKLEIQLSLLQVPGGWSAPASTKCIDQEFLTYHVEFLTYSIDTQHLSLGVSLPYWIPHLWPEAEIFYSLLLRECLLCRVQMAALKGWRHMVVFTKSSAFLDSRVPILSYLSPLDVLPYMIFPHLIQRISVTEGFVLV